MNTTPMCSPQTPSPTTADDAIDVSSSPDRHRFQRQCYVTRQEESGEPVSDDYLECLDHIIYQHNHKFDQPERCENSLEWDLRTTDWILTKARASDSYAQNLYAAMCNNEFQRQDIMPILRDQRWHCSWRYAGGIIADMRKQGDYIDWYCSGIQGYPDDTNAVPNKYVGEGCITNEIREDLLRLGWRVCDDNTE